MALFPVVRRAIPLNRALSSGLDLRCAIVNSRHEKTPYCQNVPRRLRCGEGSVGNSCGQIRGKDVRALGKARSFMHRKLAPWTRRGLIIRGAPPIIDGRESVWSLQADGKRRRDPARPSEVQGPAHTAVPFLGHCRRVGLGRRLRIAPVASRGGGGRLRLAAKGRCSGRRVAVSPRRRRSGTLLQGLPSQGFRRVRAPDGCQAGDMPRPPARRTYPALSRPGVGNGSRGAGQARPTGARAGASIS